MAAPRTETPTPTATSTRDGTEPVPPGADPGRFAIVGTGPRAQFLLRLARAVPHRFQVTGLVSRTRGRADEVAAQWGVPAFTSVPELLGATRPEFVVPCLPWDETPAVIEALATDGVRVLSETPPAPDLERLVALWDRVGAGGLVQVAEQYLLMPAHAVRLALVRDGVIGEVGSAQVCSTHLYHATSLLRGFLGTGFTDALVDAHAYSAPLVQPLGKAGWAADPVPEATRTTLATLDFGGPMGLYDFTDDQWFNPLRGRRIVVRGSTGEIDGDVVTRFLGPRSIVTSGINRRRAGVDLDLTGVDLETISFEGRIRYRNRFFGSRLSEDDLAVVELLDRVVAWAREEAPPPYPLAEACQDHLLGLAIGDSLRRGEPVRTSRQAWAR